VDTRPDKPEAHDDPKNNSEREVGLARQLSAQARRARIQLFLVVSLTAGIMVVYHSPPLALELEYPIGRDRDRADHPLLVTGARHRALAATGAVSAPGRGNCPHAGVPDPSGLRGAARLPGCR